MASVFNGEQGGFFQRFSNFFKPNKMNLGTKEESFGKNTPKDDRIKIAWFAFSCCEDNTVVFSELLNDHWQDWKKIFDFRYVPVLKKNNIFDEFDIAFIEGAIASEKQIEKLKEIREKSKKIVAVGACATVGMPAGQRNFFNEKQKEEIDFLVARFAALPKVLKVSDVVKVDAEVPGCPMDPDKFLAAVNNMVSELKNKTASHPEGV